MSSSRSNCRCTSKICPVVGSWLQAADQRSKKPKDSDGILTIEYGKPITIKFGTKELEMHDGCDKEEQQHLLLLH